MLAIAANVQVEGRSVMSGKAERFLIVADLKKYICSIIFRHRKPLTQGHLPYPTAKWTRRLGSISFY